MPYLLTNLSEALRSKLRNVFGGAWREAAKVMNDAAGLAEGTTNNVQIDGGFTNTLTITTANQTGGDVTATVPALAAAADFVMTAGNQTIGGEKSFSGDTVFSTGVVAIGAGLTIQGASPVTFSGTTGQATVVLTPALADALSVTDTVGDLLVFDTSTGARILTLMGGVAGDIVRYPLNTIVQHYGDSGTYKQIATSATAVTETIVSATTEYTVQLTDNLADAMSTKIIGGNSLFKWTTTNGSEGGQCLARTLGKQGTDVVAAAALVLGVDAAGGQGNYFDITGATQTDLITSTGWTAGSRVTLQFDSNPLVRHNQTDSGANLGIILIGGVNFQTAAGDMLYLYFDGLKWQEEGRRVLTPATMTQTYSTADATHAAPTATALTDNTVGTPNTTLEALVSGTVYGTDVAAIRNNFADLAASNNAIIVDLADIKQFVNSLVDALQLRGLLK